MAGLDPSLGWELGFNKVLPEVVFILAKLFG